MPMFFYQNKIIFRDLEKELDQISRKIEILKLASGFRDFILYTISEIFANVKEHSLAKNILAEIKIEQKSCKIKIQDDGIGFRASYLKKNIYPKDDFSAIEFALSGLSTKDFQERGFGLYSIKKMVEELKGQLIIETGFAKAIIEKNKINFQKMPKKRKGVSLAIDSTIKKIDFYNIIK